MTNSITPQEKAIGLVHTFMDIGEEQEYNTPRYLSKDVAKQCALIAADQVLDTTFNLVQLEFWMKVKKEIEAL